MAEYAVTISYAGEKPITTVYDDVRVALSDVSSDLADFVETIVVYDEALLRIHDRYEEKSVLSYAKALASYLKKIGVQAVVSGNVGGKGSDWLSIVVAGADSKVVPAFSLHYSEAIFQPGFGD